jgi:CheY-like chemotaxis protein
MFGKKTIKVLLVDDEVEFVTTLAERLRLRELKVDTVFDGTQALAFITKTEPDVIVLDLKMPGLDGLEVLREIKKTRPKIQVIILRHGTDQTRGARKPGLRLLRKLAEMTCWCARSRPSRRRSSGSCRPPPLPRAAISPMPKKSSTRKSREKRTMRTKTVPMALFDRRLWLAFSLILAVFFCAAALPAFGAEHGADAAAVPAAAVASAMPWWFWPLSLFVVSFALGIVAVLGGVGGGVLYVPIVSGFFPFHLDFVRGAGLLVALAGALAAGPGLLKKGMADLRLSIPVALIASSSAIVGAMVGLALPANVIQTALGATILAIVIMFMRRSRSSPACRSPTSCRPRCGSTASTTRPRRARTSTGRSTAHRRA